MVKHNSGSDSEAEFYIREQSGKPLAEHKLFEYEALGLLSSLAVKVS